MKSTHLELRRQARHQFRRWAADVAKGAPKPPNGMILRAGAVLAAPQPAALLEALVDAVKQDPAILGLDGDADRG